MAAMNFYVAPTERNLLASFWYDYRHFRRIRPNKSIDAYLDLKVQEIKRDASDLNRTVKVRQLNGDLLQALRNKRIRAMFVAYLESGSPKKDYQQVADAIRGAWRMEEESREISGGDGERGVEEERVMVGGERAAEEAGVMAGGSEREVEEEPALNAKAYYIAAQLYHELRGNGSEYDSLSRNLPKLIQFVRQHFGVGKLPGRFEKFKGYSYKLVLKDRNAGKKGQLKTPFRQIGDHPEIFGEKVAGLAREILAKQFN
jgi:hypothetical protein